MLIPSAALVLLWFGASAYLFGTGFYDREVAASVQQVSIPAVSGLASLQKERQLSMAYLAQPSLGLQTLLAQQQRTDPEISAMESAANGILSNAPQSIVTKFATLKGYLGQLPKIRGEVDAGVASQDDVYTFYNNLLDAATGLFDTQARVVPDVTATQGAIAGVEVFRATDLMSRASSIVSGAFASGSLSEANFLQFVSLVGAYHAELENVSPDLRPDVQDAYAKLKASSSWLTLVTAENSVIQHGSWSGGAPSDLAVDGSTWQSVTGQVSDSLTDMTTAQADEVSTEALSDGNSQLLWAGLGSLVALGIVIAAILVALRQSRLLVDRALVTRLARLRSEALELVNVRLPEIIRKLRDGQTVDMTEELPELDYGGDEIGQVATAINAAQRTAVAAAVEEAQARDGVHAVFLGIAHRNQRPLHHLLNLLDRWEQQEQDPGKLERLFQLDHQATQARRNIENLIILGGGQLGRRWRNPISVLEVLRSSISETKQYARIKLQRVPEVTITGDAVAGVVHLISELLDNAISFSSPEFPVVVSSKRVDLGVVVEVEDQGLGISATDRDDANKMLLNPPEFDVMALRDGSQLGFWVIAQLASRLDIRVELRQSPYGGVLAIVLIPDRLLISPYDGRLDNSTEEFGFSTGFPTLDPDTIDATQITAEVDDTFVQSIGQNGLPQRRLTATPDRYPDRSSGMLVGIGGVGTVYEDVSQKLAPDDRQRSDSGHYGQQPSAPAHRQPDAAEEPPTRGGTSSGRPPLPERKPQQHLVRQLWKDSDEEPTRTDDPASTRSPDEIRAQLSAFQQGVSEGRRADDPMTP
ncbi:MAG TPA: nitrate- and nitrite sensing domain-containing protein [Pseudonocardiaceae bacterium]|nr:nitrate- and nitrite sensing domain-containing protein [Pseudonocardiaceae bacterium]